MYSHQQHAKCVCVSIENNEFDLNSVLFAFDYFWLLYVASFLYTWPLDFFVSFFIIRCFFFYQYDRWLFFISIFIVLHSCCLLSLVRLRSARLSSLKAPHIIRSSDRTSEQASRGEIKREKELKTNRLYSKVIYESAVSRVLTFDKWTRCRTFQLISEFLAYYFAIQRLVRDF